MWYEEGGAVRLPECVLEREGPGSVALKVWAPMTFLRENVRDNLVEAASVPNELSLGCFNSVRGSVACSDGDVTME